MSLKFSIIIPDYNSTIIDQTLDSLEKLNYPVNNFEVIIVGIDEPGLVHTSHLIKFDQTERKYAPAEARNRGARQATGEILVFLDSDCIASANWLNALNHDFDDAKISGVGGGVKFQKNNYWNAADNFSLFHEFLATQPRSFRKQLPSLNLAIRRDIFIQLGGFDERYPLPAGEDFDFTYRISSAGYPLLFDPEAWVMHSPARNSSQALWQHSYKIGQYSTKVDPRYKGKQGFPNSFRNKPALILLSPILALAVALKIYLNTPESNRYLYCLPAVYFSKIAWCIGAAHSPLLTGSTNERNN